MLTQIIILCVAVCCLVVPTLQAVPHFDERIIGGSPGNIANYPYQVSVQHGGTHVCGGSIVTTAHVLTAAHCMLRTPSLYTVRAGTSTRGNGGTVYQVFSVLRHTKFDENYDYDVAVIKIIGTFTLGNTVAPVPLNSDVPEDGAMCVVTGWGATLTGSSASNLQFVEVPMVSNARCEEYYAGRNTITARMVCAGWEEGGRDACQGDSGGPLVCAGQQVGVVSWGMGCAQPLFPGVYSSVSDLRPWIRSAAGV